MLDELGLDMKLKIDGWLKCDEPVNHPFNFGFLSNFDEMVKCIEGYSNMQPEYGLDQYAYFTFKIQVF